MRKIRRRKSGARGLLASAFALLALTLCQPVEVRAQWATNGNDVSNTNTGNVGIGTATPGEKLTVNGKISINRAPSPGPAEVRIYNGGSVAEWAFRQASSTSHNLSISKAASGVYTDYFTINTSGNVGVGAANPNGKFEVQDTTVGNALLILSNGATNALTPLRVKSVNNGGIAEAVFETPAALRISSTDAGSTNQFRLLPYQGNIWFQNTNSSGTINFSGLNGADASGANFHTTSNYFKGVVGIGTNTPAEKLHVVGNISVTGAGTGNITASGTITGGNIQAKYQDVAEWVPSTQELSAGTVVVLDSGRSNHVLASSEAYDTRVAGVVSAQPGLLLGEGGAGKVMVATTGRVKVKVDATRAPIRIGDLLVTSGAEGVAMKSEPVELGGRKMHAPGTIIGKALEPLEKGVGEILVLLSLQ